MLNEEVLLVPLVFSTNCHILYVKSELHVSQAFPTCEGVFPQRLTSER